MEKLQNHCGEILKGKEPLTLVNPQVVNSLTQSLQDACLDT